MEPLYPTHARERNMNPNIVRISPDKAWRLFNLGGVVVSAEHEGVADAMAAAWNMPVELDPCIMTVVIDKSHFTRPLIERSGCFVLQLATVQIVRETLRLGSVSKNDNARKLEESGASFFRLPGCPAPLLEGCAGWALFERIPEPHNEQPYDLFTGRLIDAWADSRCFTNGRWHFDAPQAQGLRTLHYVSGGQFYALGESINVEA